MAGVDQTTLTIGRYRSTVVDRTATSSEHMYHAGDPFTSDEVDMRADA